MALNFTQKLIYFSNTINNLIREYNQLHGQIMSMKIEGTLFETFDEIQRVSGELRSIQNNFQHQFILYKEELPIIWKSFGSKLEEHIEAAIEHTYISDELIAIFTENNTWQRLWKARKVINVLSRLNRMGRKCTEKGKELNQLIEMIQN